MAYYSETENPVGKWLYLPFNCLSALFILGALWHDIGLTEPARMMIMSAPSCFLEQVLTAAFHTKASGLLVTHKHWTPRPTVKQRTQNGSHRHGHSQVVPWCCWVSATTPWHQGARLRFHRPHTQQSMHATHNCAVHTHNCKQLFITHSDLWLVAALMAPDPEVNAKTRREYF